MDAKVEVVALAVRLLAGKTNLIRKPDLFETFLTDLFGLESYDRQMARAIISDAEHATAAVKKHNTNRKFKKIIKNF